MGSKLVGANGAPVKTLKTVKNEVDDMPWLTSEDLKCKPMGSRLIVRGYLENTISENGLIRNLDQKALVPCMEVMKIGPVVKEHGNIKEGQWVMIGDNCSPGLFKYTHEVFHIIQEHDVHIVYDEQPAYDDIMDSSTSIVRDPRDYVRVDKMSKLKITTEERYEDGRDSEG